MDYFSKSHKRGGSTIHLLNEEVIQNSILFRNIWKNSEIFRKIQKILGQFKKNQGKGAKFWAILSKNLDLINKQG